MIFDNHAQLKFLLATVENEETELERHVVKFPLLLNKYKYIMHPIRISMLKILNQEFEMTSIEMKNSLNMSWTEYTNHSKSLEELGMVQTQSLLTVDGVQQIIILTQLGKKAFLDLRNLLIEFLEETEFEFVEEDDDTNLYPKN